MNKDYKVCILAAGVGSRMGPLSKNVNKAILPINFKGTISHIIEKFSRDIEFIIAVGHKKETIINYVELAHNDRKIKFVEIDKFVGPGTGPGYSLLHCKEYLKSPFIFFAADTIVLEKIPKPDKNWFGIAPVKNPEEYCTVKIKDNLVVQIDDKVFTRNKYAFIGLAGVKDHKIFFNSLENNQNIIEGEIQVSNGFKSLLERKLEPIGFTWFDTGSLENITIANTHLSGDKNRFDFSKGDEFLYFVGNRVIKYFANKRITINRVERAKYLSPVVPELTSKNNNFFSYEKVEGDVLYDVLNDGILTEFLDWSKNNLWIEKNLNKSDQKDFDVACKKFYMDKTKLRLNKFYEKTKIKDKIFYVNGKKIPLLEDLFRNLNWDFVIKGNPSQFHGDLQFDNILYLGSKEFLLLDWRQDFGGLTSHGDLYYDLSKLYGGMLLSYKSIKENNFSFEMSGKQVFYNYQMTSNLIDAKYIFEDFVIKNGYDLKKIKLITSLIFLNMSPLHNDPFDHLLFFLGKNMLFKNL